MPNVPSPASSRRTKHPFLRRLESKFPGPLSRTCGNPGCNRELTVQLLGYEPEFEGKIYCDGHRDHANRRRKQLRKAIEDIDRYLNGETSLPRRPRGGSPDAGFDKADLRRWKARLQWELDGIPHPRNEEPLD